MRTFLRIAGLTMVGVILLLSVGGASGYWYATRSLPMLEGNLVVPGLDQPAQVYRDRWGIPHILAHTEHDLFFVQGYVTAQDRLFAMDIARRKATGRLSEVFGPSDLESDRFYRTLGLQRVAEASLKLYSPEARAVGDAYAAGVNAYISAGIRYHLLPWEFAVLGYRPQPWTFTDSIAIARSMNFAESGHWGSQLFHYFLVQKLGEQRGVELFPNYPYRAPTILRDAHGTARLDDSEVSRLLAFVPPPSLGSNSWVVSGNRTVTGKPLLATDPHLMVQTPAVWHEVQLVLPGRYDVIGVTHPGVPGVMLGHNSHIAWGASNLNADVADLYVEKANPKDPAQFEYAGKFETARTEQETIGVKGRPPVTLDILSTRHGPIVSPLTPQDITTNGAAFSLRWTGFQPSADLEAILAIDRSQNWDEFREALTHLDAWSQNFVYADTAGNIGYRATGKIPVRVKATNGLPGAGWNGENEWDTYIPVAEMPELYNPKQGFVIAANNQVAAGNYPYHLSDEWAAPWRAIRINDLLSNAWMLSRSDMEALQNDTTDLEAKRYAALLLDACRQATGGKWSETVADARTALGEWDYVARPDSPGALVWNEFRVQLLRELFAPAMGASLYQLFLDTGTADQAMGNLLEAYLLDRKTAWLDAGSSSMRSLPQLAEQAFARTAEIVATAQGGNLDKWRWDRVHSVSFDHPLGTVQPWRKLLNRGPFPMGGDGATVDATNYQLGSTFAVTSTATWRQVVDLSDLAKSEDILAPGESGHVLSPYYLDQARAWLDGRYHPQVYREEDFKSLAPLNLVLQLS